MKRPRQLLRPHRPPQPPRDPIFPKAVALHPAWEIATLQERAALSVRTGLSSERERFFTTLRNYPALLPEAPTDCTAEQMNHRWLSEVHACLSCGELADYAYVITFEDAVPRFLELCPWHARLVMSP